MDINQIAKMIEWLDEERRRDKATIAILEQRLAQQSETMNTLQRRLNSVESDQSVIQQTSPQLTIEERDVMEKVRQEMREMLESSDARRLTAERELERRGELSRSTLLQHIKDLEEQVNKLARNTGTITEVRTEGSRVSDLVSVLQQRLTDLEKKVEEPERRLTFLEEQRRQDARRISEIETEIPEFQKQLNGIRPKLTLIEDLSIRNERRIQEIQNTEHERREQIQQFIDTQTLITQQNTRQMEELQAGFKEHDATMEANLERFETWAAAYRDMKRIINDFDRIGNRLERRINEVSEMQRLSEERFRKEWNDWREDDQKRWKALTLSNDEVWRNHDKEFEQYILRLENMEEAIDPIHDSLKRLWNLERERANMYQERYQSLLNEYDNKRKPHSGNATTSSGLSAYYNSTGLGNTGNDDNENGSA